jgi:magnesium transporter
MKLFPDLYKRSQKAGQPPGTAVYTGEKKIDVPRISIVTYDANGFHETNGATLEECLPAEKATGITWINVAGLHDVDLINKIAKQYNLHLLTIEDILNVEQRAKVEEFDGYLFITLKALLWNAKTDTFNNEQVSLVFGKDFVLSFQECESDAFSNIKDRLRGGQGQRTREHGTDYLAYRLIDAVVDQYFVVLETIGDQIEAVEELIVSFPTPQNSRTLYRLKRQMLFLRKTIWPVREAVSHLLQADGGLVTPFTTLYLRDLYDHVVQAIDTVETFRDMLGGMLDVYLSSLTNRMNEIMKVLTIISTIFIPTTFIASIYGMNFAHMPELHWRWGYPTVLGLMATVTIGMLIFFRRKKWL